MSHPLRPSQALLALAAFGALAAAAPAQAAASAALTQSCWFPLAGPSPEVLTADVVDNRITLGLGSLRDSEDTDPTWAALDTAGTARFGGVLTAELRLQRPDGLSVVAPVTYPLSDRALGPSGTPVTLASVESVLLPIGLRGPGRLVLQSLALNLKATAANGTPITSLPRAAAAAGIPDSDGDPTTFDVPCEPDPAGADQTLHVEPLAPTPGPVRTAIEPPTPTAKPVPTATVDPTRPPTPTPLPTATTTPTPEPFPTVVPVENQPTNFTCPISFAGDVATSVVGTLPAAAAPLSHFSPSLEARIDSQVWSPLRLANAATYSADIDADVLVTAPDGSSVIRKVHSTTDGAAQTERSLLLQASIGDVVAPASGSLSFSVESLKITIRAFKADGSPARLITVAADDLNDGVIEAKCRLINGRTGELGTVVVGTPTPVPPVTRTPTPTPPPVGTPGPLTPTPTKTPTPTATPTFTQPPGTPFPVTRTPTPVPTRTPTPTPTRDPTPTPVPTPTPTPQQPVTTTPGPTPSPTRGYDVVGAATLKTLITGTVPLTGSASTVLPSAPGSTAVEFTFAQSKANLVVLGTLPVVATVQLAPVGPATGPLTSGGGLTLNLKTRVKIPRVTFLGFQLFGGSGCQVKNVTTIPLVARAFTPAAGGNFTGTFSISDLANCGALTGVVSPATAGPSNAIALKLTPKQ